MTTSVTANLIHIFTIRFNSIYMPMIYSYSITKNIDLSVWLMHTKYFNHSQAWNTKKEIKSLKYLEILKNNKIHTISLKERLSGDAHSSETPWNLCRNICDKTSTLKLTGRNDI